jgi:hypothetical protein
MSPSLSRASPIFLFSRKCLEDGVRTVRFTWRNRKIRIFGAGYLRKGGLLAERKGAALGGVFQARRAQAPGAVSAHDPRAGGCLRGEAGREGVRPGNAGHRPGFCYAHPGGAAISAFDTVLDDWPYNAE